MERVCQTDNSQPIVFCVFHLGAGRGTIITQRVGVGLGSVDY